MGKVLFFINLLMVELTKSPTKVYISLQTVLI